jgi:hypothetical protein
VAVGVWRSRKRERALWVRVIRFTDWRIREDQLK